MTWLLVDEDRKQVGVADVVTAEEARAHFKAQGMTGKWLVQGEADDTPPGARCEFCAKEIKVDNDYRYVGGWERISRGGQGGTHAVRVPDRTSPRRACMWCIERLAKGLSPHQTSLMETGESVRVTGSGYQST